jgi:hypothetical protein
VRRKNWLDDLCVFVVVYGFGCFDVFCVRLRFYVGASMGTISVYE